MKKIISLLLLVVTILSIATGCSSQNTKTDKESELGTKSDSQIMQKTTQHIDEIPNGYIGIYTVDDLMNSDYNRDANYILMNDLDLSSIDDWKGLVNHSIFDGNNYTISNLKSTTCGLFVLTNEIRNVILKDVNLNISKDSNDIGCLSSETQGGTIENCTVSGKVETNYVESLGGILGVLRKDSSIYNCKSYVDIVTKDGRYGVGGIVGMALSNTIINKCDFYGTINSSNDWVGGICGNTDDGNIQILGCSSQGDLIVDESGAGGILGIADDGVTIENCSFLGNIIDENVNSYCGGIVSGTYDEATIKNCYNAGKIESECIANIICTDLVSDLHISNCAYLSNNIGVTNTNAMFANCKDMTEEDMKDINNYPFDNIDEWENVNNSYPKYIGK